MKPENEQEPRDGALQGQPLEAALDELCDRREQLLLVTPYLTFESRFMERAGADLRVRATMSRSVVRSALAQQPLRLRFPWSLGLFGGPTRILDYEEAGGTKSLRIAVPPSLGPEDRRRAFRLALLGRTSGALGSRELALVRTTVENLCGHGLGVFCLDPLPANGFQAGRPVDVSLSLDQGPQIKATGRVCHGSGQFLGLVFTPPLAGAAKDQLAAWLAPRLEEAQQQWEDRISLRLQAERAARPKAPPEGVLLVGGGPDLHARLGAALDGVQPVRWVMPAMAPFSEAVIFQPPLVLLLALSGGTEESHRLRALLEYAPPHCPIVALGIGAELEPARNLAAELKATLFLVPKTIQSQYFPKLIQGLVRKHWGQ